MFMVINKDKIISYIVSLGTVAILFMMSFVITENNENIIQTSTNNVNFNNIVENQSSYTSKTIVQKNEGNTTRNTITNNL